MAARRVSMAAVLSEGTAEGMNALFGKESYEIGHGHGHGHASGNAAHGVHPLPEGNPSQEGAAGTLSRNGSVKHNHHNTQHHPQHHHHGTRRSVQLQDIVSGSGVTEGFQALFGSGTARSSPRGSPGQSLDSLSGSKKDLRAKPSGTVKKHGIERVGAD
ncbi:hypothetical protein DFJ73DRAFT_258299 [Zopfochytrium polystomum]|nr:hypothetical protein DFJ73DRAFT_258299 [Zopfochytrium polystomum]